MKKKIITIVLGTVILFVWNAISWMALPFHSNTLTNIPEAAIETGTMRELMPSDGVYHYPGLPENDSDQSIKSVEEKLADGPRITLMVYKSGPTAFFDPMQFMGSLLINLITVVLALYVISQMNTANLNSIVLTSIGIGLISAVISDFSLMNWYMFPLDYTLVNVFDKVIAFGLLGLLFRYYTLKQG